MLTKLKLELTLGLTLELILELTLGAFGFSRVSFVKVFDVSDAMLQPSSETKFELTKSVKVEQYIRKKVINNQLMLIIN